MSHVHSNPEMMLAAQIAYLDFQGDNNNIGKKVDNILNSYGEQDAKGNWKLKPEYEGIKGIEEEFGGAKNIIEVAESTGIGDQWRKWNVVDVDDDQANSGYYAMLIDTGDGNAIITNRGTELQLDKIYKDGVEADLGLLDSTSTKQQERAEKYMEKLYYKYGDKYDKFSVGGHSLGGNLATHMVITAPEGMIEKIDRCTSMDGPGFSDEYLEKYQKEIERVRGLLEQYKWSIISNLLNPVLGSKIEYVKSEGGIIERHSLKNVKMDENGKFEQDQQEDFEKDIYNISREIDRLGIEAVIWKAANAEGLEALYYNVAVIAKILAEVLREFEIVTKNLKEWANNVYYNYIAPKVSGTYEVNNKSLSIMAGEIQALEKELGRLNDDIERLRKNLKFWSISGGYYRSKILSIQVGLESDLKKLKKMAQVAENAAKRYNSVDMQVKGKFA